MSGWMGSENICFSRTGARALVMSLTCKNGCTVGGTAVHDSTHRLKKKKKKKLNYRQRRHNEELCENTNVVGVTTPPLCPRATSPPSRRDFVRGLFIFYGPPVLYLPRQRAQQRENITYYYHCYLPSNVSVNAL